MSGVRQVFASPTASVTVLQDVQLEVPKNSFTIIYGPSGSGKTTLMNIISGLQAPTEGEVRVCGEAIYKLSTDQRAFFRSKRIGLIHQANYWVKSLSVLENVAFPLYVAGWEIGDANMVALERLRALHLEQFADYNPTLLSGGQQQNVSLARALVATPDLVLADEPTGNLDSKKGQQVMELLKNAQVQTGRTVVMITHNLEYLHFSDHQIHIHDGQIVRQRV